MCMNRANYTISVIDQYGEPRFLRHDPEGRMANEAMIFQGGDQLTAVLAALRAAGLQPTAVKVPYSPNAYRFFDPIDTARPYQPRHGMTPNERARCIVQDAPQAPQTDEGGETVTADTPALVDPLAQG